MSTDARLAFYEAEAPPAPTPRPRLPMDPGPSMHHRVAGTIPLPPDQELRITTQRALGPDRPARLVIRKWYRRQGNWWPVPNDPGVTITARNVQAFARAVKHACAALVREGEPAVGDGER